MKSHRVHVGVWGLAWPPRWACRRRLQADPPAVGKNGRKKPRRLQLGRSHLRSRSVALSSVACSTKPSNIDKPFDGDLKDILEYLADGSNDVHHRPVAFEYRPTAR